MNRKEELKRMAYDLELRTKYGITDPGVLERINTFRTKLKTKLNKELTTDELIEYLNKAMNCDEVQLRWTKYCHTGEKSTLQEDLQLLFEHSTDEQIFMKYAAMINRNRDNIEDSRKAVNIFRRLRNKDNQ